MCIPARASFLASVVAGLLVTSNTAFAQEHKDAVTSYDRAIAALKTRDCVTAVKELLKFKYEAASQLKANPEFAAQVDFQLVRCGVAPDGETFRLEGRGGPPDREIRFRMGVGADG